jgi:hypothetical protein
VCDIEDDYPVLYPSCIKNWKMSPQIFEILSTSCIFKRNSLSSSAAVQVFHIRMVELKAFTEENLVRKKEQIVLFY